MALAVYSPLISVIGPEQCHCACGGSDLDSRLLGGKDAENLWFARGDHSVAQCRFVRRRRRQLLDWHRWRRRGWRRRHLSRGDILYDLKHLHADYADCGGGRDCHVAECFRRGTQRRLGRRCGTSRCVSWRRNRRHAELRHRHGTHPHVQRRRYLRVSLHHPPWNERHAHRPVGSRPEEGHPSGFSALGQRRWSRHRVQGAHKCSSGDRMKSLPRVFLLAALLVGCHHPLEPWEEVDLSKAVKIEPSAQYVAWWNELEACSGRS